MHYLCSRFASMTMATIPNNRILVVDDEPTLCDTLKFNLELEGYHVDTAYSAEEALALDLKKYALILLDVMMGEISGFQMAKIMKKSPELTAIPIIFCTAKDTEDDMIGGLEIGADDYISKPYSIRNVLARVKAVLRRTYQDTNTSDTTADILSYEGLVVEPLSKRCIVDGAEVKLPRKEFEILCLLMSHPGRIFSRNEILKLIWPENVVVLDRVVDVNITRLRSAIGNYSNNILTRSGYGYGFQI